jgi:predicted RNA polymerase sigma factor
VTQPRDPGNGHIAKRRWRVSTWSQDNGHQARLSLTSFDVFYRCHLPVLVRYLIVCAADSGWAAEIAEDAMIAACDHWDELLTADRPDCWLFLVATRRLRRLEARARESGRPEDRVRARPLGE